jgi:hypothetical protein
LMKVNTSKERIEALKDDHFKFHLYNQGILTTVTVGSLARAALEQMSRDPQDGLHSPITFFL